VDVWIFTYLVVFFLSVFLVSVCISVIVSLWLFLYI